MMKETILRSWNLSDSWHEKHFVLFFFFLFFFFGFDVKVVFFRFLDVMDIGSYRKVW